MAAGKTAWRKALGPPGAAAAKAMAFLLIICLVECATEQRINNRGSKTPNFVERTNGWRSQRGGSCLSYGHSCWGAHGKRSGSDPVPAPFAKVPDWYLMRLLRKMSANNIVQASQPDTPRDLNGLFEVDASEENTRDMIDNAINNDVAPILAIQMRRRPEAIPMLDDSPVENSKFMQLMRGATEIEK